MNALACRRFAHRPAQHLPTGAVVRDGYEPPTPTGRGLETCAGIVIGQEVPAVPAEIGVEAERVQRALLSPEAKHFDGHRLVMPALLLALLALLLLGALGKLPQ